MPSWKVGRVFISSTFRDMQAERDHLVRFVFPRLRHDLLEGRIHLVDVDLRWGITGERDALDVCRQIVEECRPRFVCMLGGRYGWVPPHSRRSITDEEIHYAVLDREPGERGLAYFYFRDDGVTASMPESVPGEIREPDGSENQGRLATLKDEIATSGLNPFVYHPKWDPESGRLAELDAFGQRVYEDLYASFALDPDLRDDVAPVVWKALDERPRFANEDDAMEAFAEEHSQRFVLGSRAPVLERLLLHAGGSGGNGYVCLTGAPGSGKSALLAHLSRHSGLSASTLLIRHFVGASRDSTEVPLTLRRLCHEIKARCPDITSGIPENLEELSATFQELLREASSRFHVVILIDAVDRLDATWRSNGLGWLPAALPDNARILVSATSSPALEELRSRYPPPVEIHLEPLSLEDSGAIIDRFLSRFHKEFDSTQRAELLAKMDASTPLYLLAALEELRTLGTYEEITEGIRALPATTQGLFDWVLERLERDNGFHDAAGRPIGPDLVPRFGALVSASRHGLSERELGALLDPGDPHGNVAALIHLLRPYMLHRGELLDFHHSQLRQAAAVRYLHEQSHRLATHGRLARYFRGQADPNGDRTWQREDSRALAEALWHVWGAESWDEVLALLLADGYLPAAIRSLGWGWTLNELAVLLEAGPHASRNPPPPAFRAIVSSIRGLDYPLRGHARSWEFVAGNLLNGLRRRDMSGDATGLSSEWLNARPESAPGLSARLGLRFAWSSGPGYLPDLGDGLRAIAVDRQTGMAATAGSYLVLWDLDTGKVRHRLAKGDYVAVALFPARRRLAATRRDENVVELWNTDSGNFVAQVPSPFGPLRQLFCTWDGLLLGLAEKGVGRWRVEPPFELAHSADLRGVVPERCFLNTGATVLHIVTSRQIRRLDLSTAKLEAPAVESPQCISVLCHSDDDELLLSGDEDGNLHLWSVAQGYALLAHRTITSPMDPARLLGQGLNVWSPYRDIRSGLAASDGFRSFTFIDGNVHPGWVTALCLSPDAQHVVSGSMDGRIRVFAAGDLQEEYEQDLKAQPVTFLVYVGERRLWAGTASGSLWQVDPGIDEVVNGSRRLSGLLNVESSFIAAASMILRAVRGHEPQFLKVGRTPLALEDGPEFPPDATHTGVKPIVAPGGLLVAAFPMDAEPQITSLINAFHPMSVQTRVFYPDGTNTLLEFQIDRGGTGLPTATALTSLSEGKLLLGQLCLRVIDVATREELSWPQPPAPAPERDSEGHDVSSLRSIRLLSVSPDGLRVAVAWDSPRLEIVRLDLGHVNVERDISLQEPASAVTWLTNSVVIVFLPDGRIPWCDLNAGIAGYYPSDIEGVDSAVFSGSRKWLAAASTKLQRLYLIRWPDVALCAVESYPLPIADLMFDADETMLYASDRAGNVIAYELDATRLDAPHGRVGQAVAGVPQNAAIGKSPGQTQDPVQCADVGVSAVARAHLSSDQRLPGLAGAGPDTSHSGLVERVLDAPVARVGSPTRVAIAVPTPHPSADPERAARLNIEYQHQRQAWQSLSWWRRLRTPKPQPPVGT